MGPLVTLTLHLGVIDVPYVDNEPEGKRRARRLAKAAKAPPPPKNAEHTTTGDVATILEAKYGVMGAFFENHEVEIVGDLESGLSDALENLVGGGPVQLDAFGDATSKIEERFKAFLSSREAEAVGIPGTPTKAARRGVSHRKKHPYAKANPRRPSFIDTGLYQASMKAWVD
jgi:hypothetical protein